VDGNGLGWKREERRKATGKGVFWGVWTGKGWEL
jgi:hypothetical protein